MSFSADLSNYRPVYAPKDLLEVLLSLKGPMRQEDEYISRLSKSKQIFNSLFYFQYLSKMGVLAHYSASEKFA